MKQKHFILIMAVLLLLTMAPIFLPWSKVLLTMILSKGLAVLGVMVLLRAGQVSFGHAMFFATSAYAAAFLTKYMVDVELLVLVPITVLISILWGAVVGVFIVRYRYIFFSMLNLAISMVIFALLEKFYHVTGGSDGMVLSRPEFFGQMLERAEFETAFYYFVLIIAIITAYGVHRFLHAPIGYALTAIKTNETRVEYLGLSAQKVLLAGYILSAALAGLGGVFNAIVQGVVTPEFGYWIKSGEFIFIAILGGSGNVLGAFAGASVYEIIRMYFAASAAGMWQMLLGSILLIMIMLAPEGIIGLVNRKRPAKNLQ